MTHGIDNKLRFTVKYADGTLKRFGTCDPKEDERHTIEAHEKGDTYCLVHLEKDDTTNSIAKSKSELPADTLVAWGYYDHEHKEWLSLKDFIKKLTT